MAAAKRRRRCRWTRKTLTKLIYAGHFLTTIFELDIDGKTERVIPRDYQLDVVKDIAAACRLPAPEGRLAPARRRAGAFHQSRSGAGHQARRLAQHRLPFGGDVGAGRQYSGFDHRRSDRARLQRRAAYLGLHSAAELQADQSGQELHRRLDRAAGGRRPRRRRRRCGRRRGSGRQGAAKARRPRPLRPRSIRPKAARETNRKSNGSSARASARLAAPSRPCVDRGSHRPCCSSSASAIPAAQYAGNRHNIGFMAVEAHRRRAWLLARRARDFQGLVREGTIAGERVLALLPQTYMNESGRAVGEALRFHKIALGDVVVFHDELDLPPAKCRVKIGGGAAGHNGLRSIGAHIGQRFQARAARHRPSGRQGAACIPMCSTISPRARSPGCARSATRSRDNAALIAKRDDAGLQNKIHLAMEAAGFGAPKRVGEA